jgi:hypothetical protein
MRLAKRRIRGPGRPSRSSRTSAIAAAPSPKRLFTTAVRIVPSNAYAAEQTSMHAITANSPGCIAVQPATAASAFRPALHPIPTTSTREHVGDRPSRLISSALKPGLMKPVEETQHRCRT